jgi:hypothetical protein
MQEAQARARTLWHEARALACDPANEWTYPWHVQRALLLREAIGAFGQYFYEPVKDFDKLNVAENIGYRISQSSLPDWTGWEIHVGFRVFDSVYGAPNGFLAPPRPDERFRGRHFVRVVGWDPERDALVLVPALAPDSPDVLIEIPQVTASGQGRPAS